MRRSLFIIIALLMLVPAMLGARNLFEIGLGFSGIYDTNNPQDFDRFLEGMASGENWTIGVGLNTRFSILDLSVMAMLPTGNQVENEALSVLSSVALQVPFITDLIYVSVGGGLTTEFLYPEDGSDARVAGRSTSEATFADVVVDSPLHLRFGLDVLIGSAKVGLFYLLDSMASIREMGEPGGWADLFRSSGNDKVGMVLQLALF
jgi:hypothetical protein